MRLYVANTTSGSLSIVDITNPAAPAELAQVKVGLDPVGVAVRPKLNPADPNEDELIFVTNHISDSVSVVSRAKQAVVQTLQALDANGVTQTNEPTGVTFASPSRAFVTLDEPNQVLVLDLDASGNATINPTRLAITAQAPRALTVSNGKLYVASFSSNNQTEFPSCAPDDTRGFNPGPDRLRPGLPVQAAPGRRVYAKPFLSHAGPDLQVRDEPESWWPGDSRREYSRSRPLRV